MTSHGKGWEASATNLPAPAIAGKLVPACFDLLPEPASRDQGPGREKRGDLGKGKRLGHAQISVTMDIYSHVLPSMQQEAANK